jgi:hypothetical protein
MKQRKDQPEGDREGACPVCGNFKWCAAWCRGTFKAPVRKAVQAKPTVAHKDRTKYDRKRVKVAVEMPSGKRHVDCRSVLLDPKDD